MLLGVAFPLWVGWLSLAAEYNQSGQYWILEPVLPSLFLLVAMLIGDAFLAQRPWSSDEERRTSHLWWCTPAAQSEDVDGEHRTRGASGRGASGRTDAEDICQRLASLEESIAKLLADPGGGSWAERSAFCRLGEPPSASGPPPAWPPPRPSSRVGLVAAEGG